MAARQGDVVLFADRTRKEGVDIHVGRHLLPLGERGIAFERAGGEMHLGQRRHRVAQHRQVVAGVEPKFELRSEEHTSELHSLMRISYAVFCLKKKKQNKTK